MIRNRWFAKRQNGQKMWTSRKRQQKCIFQPGISSKQSISPLKIDGLICMFVCSFQVVNFTPFFTSYSCSQVIKIGTYIRYFRSRSAEKNCQLFKSFGWSWKCNRNIRKSGWIWNNLANVLWNAKLVSSICTYREASTICVSCILIPCSVLDWEW